MSKGGNENIYDYQAINIADCSAKPLGRSNLVMCLSETASCYWRQAIAGNTLCAHTLNFMIAREDEPFRQAMAGASGTA